MREHKHTHKNYSYSGVRCVTSDTLSLITEVCKHMAGGEDVCCACNHFQIKINSKCVKFYNLYPRDFTPNNTLCCCILVLQGPFPCVKRNLYSMNLI